MKIDIPLPRLLDASLQETARLTPIRLSLKEQLAPLSTAQLVLPEASPIPAPRDLVELYDEQGSTGVFRVTAVEATPGHSYRVELSHSLCTLQDSMVDALAFTGTVQEALSRLLAFQHEPLWRLGDVDVPEDLTVIYAAAYTDLLSALELLLALLPEGYHLETQQQDGQWLLHLRALPAEAACVASVNRNLHSLRRSVDSSRLCTRVYPFGAEVETGPITLVPLEGRDYLQADSSPYGVVSRTIQSDLIFDVPTLKEVALRYLDRHSQPDITLTAEGADLSCITGRAEEAFRPGRLCRLELPDGPTSLRILSVERPDVFGQPGQVTLTLANHTRHETDEEELIHLVRQVTASKLLGGSVTEITDDNRAHGTTASPVVHYFTVEDWAGILDVRVVITPDNGVRISELRVDDVYPPVEEWRSGAFSLMSYLTRDALGRIAPGEHKLVLHPTTGTAGESCGVSSTVTMTVIETKTQA